MELGGVLALALLMLFVVVNVDLIVSCGGFSFFPEHVFDRFASLGSHVGVDVKFTAAG